MQYNHYKPLSLYGGKIANNTVGHTYHKLRHFLVRANWSVDAVNERRLQVMWERRQTKPSRS